MRLLIGFVKPNGELLFRHFLGQLFRLNPMQNPTRRVGSLGLRGLFEIMVGLGVGGANHDRRVVSIRLVDLKGLGGSLVLSEERRVIHMACRLC